MNDSAKTLIDFYKTDSIKIVAAVRFLDNFLDDTLKVDRRKSDIEAALKLLNSTIHGNKKNDSLVLAAKELTATINEKLEKNLVVLENRKAERATFLKTLSNQKTEKPMLKTVWDKKYASKKRG